MLHRIQRLKFLNPSIRVRFSTGPYKVDEDEILRRLLAKSLEFHQMEEHTFFPDLLCLFQTTKIASSGGMISWTLFRTVNTSSH